MTTDEIEMRCLYGQGICIKNKCYAYYVHGFNGSAHCRFVDNHISPVYTP